MGLILSNYRLGGNNAEPDKGTLWPNAYCRFRAGGQDMRNPGGMSAILCVQIWASAEDYAAAKAGDRWGRPREMATGASANTLRMVCIAQDLGG